MQGIVKIHNKEYKTVALRVSEFRGNELTSDWSIETDLVHNNPELVIMKASIKNSDGRVIGTGWAEEIRGSTNINKTSALENCETSAIGRALASIGLAGEEYASANEVSDAIIKQKQMEIEEVHLKYISTVRDYFDEIMETKAALANDDIETARASFKDIPEPYGSIIWKAPSKGGIFTTEERRKLTEGK